MKSSPLVIFNFKLFTSLAELNFDPQIFMKQILLFEFLMEFCMNKTEQAVQSQKRCKLCYSVYWRKNWLCRCLYHLNNYFNFHVCLSFLRLCVRACVRACVQKLTAIPALVQQNVTNKSYLVCVMSEKYAFWVTLRPQSDRCCCGKAKVRILDLKTTCSEFQMASQISTERGEAELHIFDFKTTWSEFQKPS